MTDDEIDAALAKEAETLWQAGQETLAAQEAAVKAATSIERLPTNPQAALQKAMVRDGWAPISKEFTWKWNDQEYVGQWGAHFSATKSSDSVAANPAGVWFCEVGVWEWVQFASVKVEGKP